MSTLPETPPESKPKTLGEIARNQFKNRASGDPNKPVQKATPGKRINDRWMHEIEKFLGKPVEVTVYDGQVIEGTCVSLSITGGTPIIDTDTETVIIRNWAQIRRSRSHQRNPAA